MGEVVQGQQQEQQKPKKLACNSAQIVRALTQQCKLVCAQRWQAEQVRLVQQTKGTLKWQRQ